ncbi:MAG: YopX family protein [Tannerella sp.]|jgi:uncharacterized phage protein (TIGR01671 family)|nr:YopX family protein [Tannerella sp.]
MRQIKFRGKKTNTGKWVQGGIAFNEDRCFIALCTGYSELTDVSKFIGVEVIPETVGQFTWICDKTGKEIYEGDIIKIRFVNNVNIPVNIGVVEFSHGGFLLNNSTVNSYRDYETFEVIGNIHENKDE